MWQLGGRMRPSTRSRMPLAAALVGVALLAAACSSDSKTAETTTTQDPVAAAEARVATAQTSLTKAKDTLTAANQQFCSETKDYVVALDRYGKLFTDSKATVGDVKTGGADLAAPRESVSSAATAVDQAQSDLASAEKELADAQAALADAKATASGASTSATTPAPTTTTTLVPPATISRVKQAEADFAKTSEGITDSTPLAEATAAYNSAAVALQVAWLRLVADAGCLTDEQQAQAVAQVTAYTAALQTELQQAGYYKGAIDGIYGPQTLDAVTQLQKDNGLPTTGFVDRATATALDQKLAALGQQAAAQAADPNRLRADRAQADRLLDGADRRQLDPGAHRRVEEVPDRARRPTHRRGRRRDPRRLRTGPRARQDLGDDHHHERPADHHHDRRGDHHNHLDHRRDEQALTEGAGPTTSASDARQSLVTSVPSWPARGPNEEEPPCRSRAGGSSVGRCSRQ